MYSRQVIFTILKGLKIEKKVKVSKELRNVPRRCTWLNQCEDQEKEKSNSETLQWQGERSWGWALLHLSLSFNADQPIHTKTTSVDQHSKAFMICNSLAFSAVLFLLFCCQVVLHHLEATFSKSLPVFYWSQWKRTILHDGIYVH